MGNRSFISGLEELVARIVSLALSLVFFVVYVYAAEELVINWQSVISFLLIFWLIYETLAYLLYIIFRFFGDNTKTGSGLTIPVHEDETDGGLPASATITPEPNAE